MAVAHQASAAIQVRLHATRSVRRSIDRRAVRCVNGRHTSFCIRVRRRSALRRNRLTAAARVVRHARLVRATCRAAGFTGSACRATSPGRRVRGARLTRRAARRSRFCSAGRGARRLRASRRRAARLRATSRASRTCRCVGRSRPCAGCRSARFRATRCRWPRGRRFRCRVRRTRRSVRRARRLRLLRHRHAARQPGERQHHQKPLHYCHALPGIHHCLLISPAFLVGPARAPKNCRNSSYTHCANPCLRPSSHSEELRQSPDLYLFNV